MVADRNAGEDLLGRSDRDWTVVYATALKDGPQVGYKTISGRIPPKTSIRRADVAAALLATVSDPTAIKQTRTIAGQA